ncbi:MAG: hypothetical protein QOI20_3276 [Acidimicrobiaceae bacterium]|jgi:hypothetical protein|nr:hypothetical protein [Acidimicrobiaceae bacterium]
MSKLPKARLVHLRINELSGVDRPCHKPATVALMKREPSAPDKITRGVDLAKRAVLTTATNGHSHLVPSVDEQQSGMTSSESANDGSYAWHSHPWVRDGAAITIGEAAGHTHEVVAPTTKRLPAPMPAANSTTAPAAPSVNPTKPPERTMTTDADKIAALEKRNTELAKLLALALTLPEAQRLHAATLPADEIEPFVGKSFTDREAIVKSKLEADPVVYKTVKGVEIRKSQGALMEQLARDNDANAAELEKSKATGLVALYKARAKTEIGHLAGDEDTKVAALKALDTIADEKVRDSVTAMLKGADAAMKSLGKPVGADPGGDAEPADALQAFNDGAKKFAEEKGIKDEGLALERFLTTEKGIELKKAYDATRAYGRQAG